MLTSTNNRSDYNQICMMVPNVPMSHMSCPSNNLFDQFEK